MNSEIEKLHRLLRHIDNVRVNCRTIGEVLITRGFFDLGKALIAYGLVHDHSKLTGIEWDDLGSDDVVRHEEAKWQHVRVNDHHPESWVSIHHMYPVVVYEMVADWAARSHEQGTCLRKWIEEVAMVKFDFAVGDSVYDTIQDALSILLEPEFCS